MRMIEENEGYRIIVKMISEASGEEYGMQCFKAELLEKSGLADHQGVGMWNQVAVKAMRKGKSEDQGQRRQGEQGQNSGQEQGKQVRFGDDELFEDTRAESTNELKETDGLAELRTGRGSAGFVRGRDERFWVDETSKNWKGKGNGGRGEHEGKGRGFGRKGFQQSVREE